MLLRQYGGLVRVFYSTARQKVRPPPPVKLLKPRELSARLSRLCDNGKLDDAINTLKTSPRDAQNVPVWNTMIWECFKSKKFKTAFSLYTDMKRRGFRPNIRTYQTVLNGYAKIGRWDQHTQQLENVHAIYRSFLSYRQSLDSSSLQSTEDYNAPLTAYFSVLGHTGLQQNMFDIYYSLDKTGPFAPNHYLYSSMFRALSTDAGPGAVEKAASARLLWAQLLKASERNNFPIDSFLVSGVISVLARGRPADQEFAFQIIKDFFGLSDPVDPSARGSITLQPESLASILFLCNSTQRHATGISFFNQTKNRCPDIIDRAHVESALQANIECHSSAEESVQLLEWMLRQEITRKHGGTKIRPAKSTFDLVLKTCWQRKDWKSAMRTFDLMTGLHAHDFMDGSVASVPRFTKRSDNRNLLPEADTLSILLRTALATGNSAHLRQGLRIVEHSLSRGGGVNQMSRKTAKKELFFSVKLAECIRDAVSASQETPHTEPAELERWKHLAEEARHSLRLAKKI